MSLNHLAQHMAAQGRNGDSMLMHVTPKEVMGLQALAQQHGGSLTTNPHTGLPEANFLDDLGLGAVNKLVTPLAGAALSYFGGIDPMTAGMLLGGGQALATGDLNKGLMAGLGAWGGASLAGGLGAAGLGEVGPQIAKSAAEEAAKQGLTGEAAQEFVNNEVKSKLAEANLAGEGASAAMKDPSSFFKTVGGGSAIKGGLPVLAALAPLMGADSQQGVNAPKGSQGYIRPSVYDPVQRRFIDQAPVKVEDWGSRTFANGGAVGMADGGISDSTSAYNFLNGTGPNPFANAARGAAYDPTVGLAEGQIYWDNVSKTYKTYHAPTTTTTAQNPTGTPAGTGIIGGNNVIGKSATQPRSPEEQARIDKLFDGYRANDILNGWEPGTTAAQKRGEDFNNILGFVAAPAISAFNWLQGKFGNSGNPIAPPTTGVDVLTDPNGDKTVTGIPVNTTTLAGISDASKGPQVSDQPIDQRPEAGGPITYNPTPDAGSTPAFNGGFGSGTPTTPDGTFAGIPGTNVNALAQAEAQRQAEAQAAAQQQAAEAQRQAEAQQNSYISNYGGGEPTSTTSDGGGSSGAFTGGFGGGGGGGDAVGGFYKNGKFNQKPKKMAGGGIAALMKSVKRYADGGISGGGNLHLDVPINVGGGGSGVSGDAGGGGFGSDAGGGFGGKQFGNNMQQGGRPQFNGPSNSPFGLPLNNSQQMTNGQAYQQYVQQMMGNTQMTPMSDNFGMMQQPFAMASGGMTPGEYNLGSYSDGGRLLKGPGDGVSDSIPATIGHNQPARLAEGEFVIPARIVSELGNGSTDAGAKQLYAMMNRIQNGRKKSMGKDGVAVNSKAARHLPA